jgi:hypothetical protein
MRNIHTLCFRDIAEIYCSTQVGDYDSLRQQLNHQRIEFKPTGWMLLRCEMFDSSYFGQHTLLPYGPNNTYKEVPDRPISPRGLASDMSVIVAITTVQDWEHPGDPVEQEFRILVESNINRIVQGKNYEAYDRQLAMEVVCQRWADEIRKPVVLLLREESGQIEFKPLKRKKKLDTLPGPKTGDS